MSVLLKVEQAGTILDVKPHAVYRLIREQIIPPTAVVRIGKSVRLHGERLREWVDAGGTAADSGGQN